MTSILLTLSLACPATLVMNNSNQTWNNFDRTTMLNSFNRCGQKYENSPCLKMFSKQAERTHRAICGGTVESNSKLTKNYRR